MLFEKNSVINSLYFLSVFGCGYFLNHLTCFQVYTPALLTASFTLATTGVQMGAEGMLKKIWNLIPMLEMSRIVITLR